MRDPFVALKSRLNVFVNLTFLAFVLSAIAMLIWGTPTGVQRLGAFWIAFVAFSFGLMKLVSNLIREAAYGRGVLAGEFDEKIGKNLRPLPPNTYSLLSQYLAGTESDYTREEAQKFIDELDDHITGTVAPTDLLIVSLATLQTGFGDLLFCLFRTSGNVACSP